MTQQDAPHTEQLALDLPEATLPPQFRLDPEARRLGLHHLARIRQQIEERAADLAAADEAQRRAIAAARLDRARRRRAA